METTYLPTTGPEGTLGAIAFCAVLAYPNEIAKRDRFVLAAKTAVSKYIVPRGKNRGIFPDDIKRLNNKNIDNTINRGVARIYRRYKAALMLRAILDPGSSITGVNKAVEALSPDDVINTKSRIWSESKPVVHLAYAFFQKVLDQDFADSERQIDFMSLWLDPSWLEAAIDESNQIKSLLRRFIPSFYSADFVQILKLGS